MNLSDKDSFGLETSAPNALNYWRETRQPIYSAALILPFVVVYEVGILLLRSELINGGDAIVRTLFGRFFNLVGVNFNFVSLAVMITFFLIWQIVKKGVWRIRLSLLAMSFFESLLYAVVLFMLLGYLVQYLPRSNAMTAPTRAICASENLTRPATIVPLASLLPLAHEKPGLQDFVLYCGAGVYEELVFRVMLLGLLLLVFTRLFHMEHAYGAVWAVIVGALIFAAFHHIGGEAFTLGRFLQRSFAGLYFAAIYLNRSFGIAVASHAFYDILIGLNHWR
ncbi:MAG: CPBP family intramembrane glutamic endopeptidase [Planctomycetota bacterium]